MVYVEDNNLYLVFLYFKTSNNNRHIFASKVQMVKILTLKHQTITDTFLNFLRVQILTFKIKKLKF